MKIQKYILNVCSEKYLEKIDDIVKDIVENRDKSFRNKFEG